MKYAVGDANESNVHAVPPWAITHFRLNVTSSEFFPFGRPLFLHAIAVYRGYKTTEMLIDMLRVASFPREVIKITSPDTLTPMDRVYRVNQVREMVENMSPVTNNRDIMGVGERIYTMADLWEFELVDPDIQMDRLGDLHNKREDLILATGIPDTILVPSEGGGLGGESGSAVLFQNKIFQRNVEEIKGAILTGVSSSFRTHLALTSQFDGEDTEFELLMPVNADMYSEDKMNSLTASLDVATAILNNLAQALGLENGNALPIDVVKDVIKSFVSIDPIQLDKWVNQIAQSVEDQPEESDDSENGAGGVPFITPITGATGGTAKRKTARKVKTQKLTEKAQKFYEQWKAGDDHLIRETYFQVKEDRGMREGIMDGYQFYNNTMSIREAPSKPGYSLTGFGAMRKFLIKQERNRLLEQSSRQGQLF
jgi:hypothetical protein